MLHLYVATLVWIFRKGKKLIKQEIVKSNCIPMSNAMFANLEIIYQDDEIPSHFLQEHLEKALKQVFIFITTPLAGNYLIVALCNKKTFTLNLCVPLLWRAQVTVVSFCVPK